MKAPQWAVTLFKEHWQQALVALGGLLLPVLGFLLSPAKTLLYRRLWPERVEITLEVTPRVIREGDTFTVRAITTPLKGREMTGGILRLHYPDESISPESKADFSKLTSGKDQVISEFRFLALAPGPLTISAGLRTEVGASYTASTTSLIRTRASTDRPSFQNLTGAWSFHISDAQGELKLIQKGKDLTGEYELEPHWQGQVKGFRDGCVFHVALLNANSGKTILDGNVGQIVHSLQIKGQASEASSNSPGSARNLGNFMGSAMASTDESTPDCISADK